MNPASSWGDGTPIAISSAPTHWRTMAAGLLAIALLSTASLAEPELELERYRVADGLSQSGVLAILEDSRGQVWLATEDGLNRFDGKAFQVYRPDPSDPSSLPAGPIRALAEDASGHLWVACEGGGLARWDPLTDRFVRFHKDPRSAEPRLSDDLVTAVATDAAGRVWAGLRHGGLLRLDLAGGEVEPFGRRDARVWAIAPSTSGDLWVATSAGVDRVDSDSGAYSETVAGATRALYEGADGVLWIGFENGGLGRFHPADASLSTFRHDPSDPASLTDDRVRAIAQDDLGRLWVGTLAGLDLLDSATGRFTHASRDGQLAQSLGRAEILALHRDREGAVWIGTHLAGAARWDRRMPTFSHLRVSEASGSSETPGDIVTSFAEDSNGALWVGTYGNGLARIDRTSGAITRFRHDVNDPAGLGDDRVMALLADRRGQLWIGTKGAGVQRYDAEGHRFVTHRHDPSNPRSLGADGVMTLYEGPDGTVWVGTFGGGLSGFDRANGTFRNFRHDPEDASSLGSDRVTAVLDAGEGRLWVGTDGGGLHLFDPATGQARAFRHSPGDPASLPADTVFSLHRASDGVLWVGTLGGGLARMTGLSTDAPRFTTFGVEDGLPNGVVYAIRPDDDGGLWVSTNNGLSRFDPSSRRFDNFSERHGLQGKEFNFGSSLRSADGTLYFGGMDGYNAFQPESLMRRVERLRSGSRDRLATGGPAPGPALLPTPRDAPTSPR